MYTICGCQTILGVYTSVLSKMCILSKVWREHTNGTNGYRVSCYIRKYASYEVRQGLNNGTSTCRYPQASWTVVTQEIMPWSSPKNTQMAPVYNEHGIMPTCETMIERTHSGLFLTVVKNWLSFKGYTKQPG